MGAWAVRVLKAQILRVLGVWWAVPNPEYNKQYTQHKRPKGLEYSEHQECRARRYFECSQHILPKYCQYSKYSSSPPESNLLQLPSVGPSVNAVCNKMRMKLLKRRWTDIWSKYPSYSQYTAHIETILVLLRVFSVLAVPVLAVTTGRNTASTEHYPQYSSLK